MISVAATEILILAVIATVAIAVACRSPFHAFCVFITTLPFESALAIRGTLTITPVYLGLLAVLIITSIYASRRTTVGSIGSKLNPYILVYLGVATLSLVMTILVPPPMVGNGSALLRLRTSEYRSIVQVGFLFFSASAYFLTLLFCATPERVRLVTRLFLGVSALTALYGLFQVVGVWCHVPLVGPVAANLYNMPASLRPNATFQEPMNFGHFIVVALPVLASLFLHRQDLKADDRRRYGFIALVMLLAMAAALISTIGRGAWLGAGVAALVLLAASNRRGRMRALPIGVAGLVAAATFAIFAFGGFHGAWATVANRFRPTSANLADEQRLWYLPLLIQLAREHPILGVGYGNYPLYQVFTYNLYGIAGAYGVFSEALVDTGIAGLASLLALVAACMWMLVRTLAAHPNSEWRAYLAGWLASLAGSFTAYIFFADRMSIYMWVALGLSAATVRAARQSSRSV